MEIRNSGPGKSFRKGLSLVQAVRKFSDECRAEAWFVARRWPHGIHCPYCDSRNIAARPLECKTQIYRCNACKRDFTVKTGTVMHCSKLALSKWAIALGAIYVPTPHSADRRGAG